jgi:hypothetical protein
MKDTSSQPDRTVIPNAWSIPVGKKRKHKKSQRRASASAEQSISSRVPLLPAQHPETLPAIVGEHLPCDIHLLDRVRTQWQFGDWKSLAALDPAALAHHPERARLCLFAGAGQAQQGDLEKARASIRAAVESGVNRQLLGQVLISGVYNTLGRAAALSSQHSRSIKHFSNAVAVPGLDLSLVVRARMSGQLEQLGIQRVNGASAIGTGSPNDYVNSDQTHLVSLSIPDLVAECMDSLDIHEKIDQVIDAGMLTLKERFDFLVSIADRFLERKDKLTAQHFINVASQYVTKLSPAESEIIAKRFILIDKPDSAMDVLFSQALSAAKNTSDHERRILQNAFDKLRSPAKNKEHGHELLLSHLLKNWPKFKDLFEGRQTPVLVEIGSTREIVEGQGSTRKIAEFCKRHGVRFITVDMDPHNTHMANNLFKEMQCDFQAINMKGEDYLRDYRGNFEFIFLDAYDFDHGQHSELRQSRYRKMLGDDISDQKCHQMHLDCARSLVEKLAPIGLVCLDDTWLEDGAWTAKGTLAMPLLLKNGFQVIESRNRAALLARVD